MPRGRKRRYKKKRKNKIYKSLPEHKMRMVLVGDVATSGANGFISASVAMNTLTNCYNQSSTIQVPLQEVGSVKALWDLFRGDSVRITYTPNYTAFSQIQFPRNQTPLYLAYDPDNSGILPDASTLVTRSDVARKSIGKPWTHYQRNKRGYFSSSTVSYHGGFNNLGNEATYVQGIVAMNSQHPIAVSDGDGNPIPAPNGFVVGQIMVEFFGTFKGRQ